MKLNSVSLFAPAVSLFLVHCASPSNGVPATADDNDIIGGGLVRGLSAAGMVLVHDGLVCTGTLISERAVLTAAHCVVDHNAEAKDLAFAVGPATGQMQGKFPVAEVAVHPAYTDTGEHTKNDVAVLLLQSPVPVSPIPLYEQPLDDAFVGTKLFAVGFGISNADAQSGAGLKRAVELPVTAVGASRFRLQESGKSVCSGDSGGPVVMRNADGKFQLVGVNAEVESERCDSWSEASRVDVYRHFVMTHVSRGVSASEVQSAASP